MQVAHLRNTPLIGECVSLPHLQSIRPRAVFSPQPASVHTHHGGGGDPSAPRGLVWRRGANLWHRDPSERLLRVHRTLVRWLLVRWLLCAACDHCAHQSFAETGVRARLRTFFECDRSLKQQACCLSTCFGKSECGRGRGRGRGRRVNSVGRQKRSRSIRVIRVSRIGWLTRTSVPELFTWSRRE